MLFIFSLFFFQTLVCQPITSADNGIDVDVQPIDSRVLGMDGHAHAFRNANVNWACGVVQQIYNMKIDITVHVAHVKYHMSNMNRGFTKSKNEYPTTTSISMYGYNMDN